MKIESILIDAGETPMGTLTMGTHKPRKVIKARVVRNRDWLRIKRVIDATDFADRNFPFAQEKPREFVQALRTALSKHATHIEGEKK